MEDLRLPDQEVVLSQEGVPQYPAPASGQAHASVLEPLLFEYFNYNHDFKLFKMD